jgi:hypothetical protein
VADDDALRLHCLGDRPRRLPLGAQTLYLPDRLLLLGINEQELALAPVAERDRAAEEAALRPLVYLRLPDTLTNPVALVERAVSGSVPIERPEGKAMFAVLEKGDVARLWMPQVQPSCRAAGVFNMRLAATIRFRMSSDRRASRIAI